MNPEDIKHLLEGIEKGRKCKWTNYEKLLLGLARRAVRQQRWICSRDAFELQRVYRKSQGSSI